MKLTGCHVKAAKAVAKGKTFDEESCEQLILGAFGATTSGPGCPSCLSNLKGSVVEQFVDQTAFVKFCGGTAALGDSDDNGTVPADAKAVKCETKVAIASGIHAAAITNCNAALAKQLFKGKTFDTARCEAKATSRLMATKTTDCPSCIRLEAIDSFQKFLLHANAGLVFCASAGSEDAPFSLAIIFQVAKSARARVSARRAIIIAAALTKMASGLLRPCVQSGVTS